MRRFALYTGNSYAAFSDSGNRIGVYYLKDGEEVCIRTRASKEDSLKEFNKTSGEAYIKIERDSNKGGDIVIPIHRNNMKVTVMKPYGGHYYYSEINVPTPSFVGDYSIIIVKKGVNFNERNKWTATVHVSENDIDAGMTNIQLAEKLVKAINGNIGSGITASNEDALIMLECDKLGVDYKVIPADNMFGVAVTEEENGEIAHGSFAHIKELATKAAAACGFTDTFEDSVDFYKNYPLENVTENEDIEAYIITATFAEPRATKTVDQAIKQIVQIAVTNAAVSDDLIEALNIVGGVLTSSANAPT